MPDITKKTLSATQIPGLFNQSPYVTLWMLYHWAVSNLELDIAASTRMTWGKKLQSVILLAAAEQMRLEVRENAAEEYRRLEGVRIGYTADADVFDPALGIGAVEAKNVDALVYRSEWTEDAAPPHIELQLQVQIMVLAALHGSCQWGIIPVLIGGNDLVIHRRKPNPEQQNLIIAEVADFWKRCDERREPDAFGSPREIPGLAQLYAERKPGKVIEVMTPEAHEIVQAYDFHKAQRLEHEKLEEASKVKIRAMLQDAEYLNVPGYEVRATTVKIAERTQLVKAHTQTRLKLREIDL
jgi:predicted phage-related endonuclease